MPAPRKSNIRHLAAGTYRADRHRTTPPVQPLDQRPPAHLAGAALEAWHELVRAGAEFLGRSDVFVVEIAAGLVAKVRSGNASAAELGHLCALLNKMGLTPTGRRSLDPVRAADGNDNPFDAI